MARLEFFVVSESVSIDQTSNAASVFNILEEIGTPQFPILIPYCAAISLWCREEADRDEDFQCTLRIIRPGGERNDISTNFRPVRPRHRVVQRIQGLQLTQAGELRFELLLNGKHAADHIVTVVQVRPIDVAGSGEILRH